MLGEALHDPTGALEQLLLFGGQYSLDRPAEPRVMGSSYPGHQVGALIGRLDQRLAPIRWVVQSHDKLMSFQDSQSGRDIGVGHLHFGRELTWPNSMGFATDVAKHLLCRVRKAVHTWQLALQAAREGPDLLAETGNFLFVHVVSPKIRRWRLMAKARVSAETSQTVLVVTEPSLAKSMRRCSPQGGLAGSALDKK